MKSFVEAWSTNFQAEKYPLNFYFSKIREFHHTESRENTGKLIIELLHWKDGKVLKDNYGEVVVENERYTLLPTKPNTYHISKHKETFYSIEFFQWEQEVKVLKTFDALKVKDLSHVFNLYGKDTLVIPSFILHVISPMIYPLYDQHVERAKRVLLAQEVHSQKSDVNFLSYQEYQTFFRRCYCPTQVRFQRLKI